MNVIFGSGIVGLVAKEILAGDWMVVPFGRSRFFSWPIPLDDNFIVRDQGIDELVKHFGGKIVPVFYKRAFSVSGQLITESNEMLCKAWISKIFAGHEIPSQSEPYWRTRLCSPIYDLRTTKLYAALLQKYFAYLADEAKKGEVTEIGDHYFVRGGQRTDFENAISTIPLPALLKLMGVQRNLKAVQSWYICLDSKTIDLEGCNQAFVVDSILDFYKVVAVAPQRYVFHCVKNIPRPGTYLMPIIQTAEIIDGTSIKDVIPTGEIPNLSDLETRGVYCVGSCAQWDWCADVGSNFLRLVRYAQRGYKPA